MKLNETLLKVLACPKCKSSVSPQGTVIVCEHCQLAYPLRDGIPVMLIDETRCSKKI
ncbi:MAG: tetraacyldisaccharide 4'-kinase [Desulfuromonas sp.]|nr:MAG: tetraacyldisaccharide 4'-kinase [Desulfuromonas sp.]